LTIAEGLAPVFRHDAQVLVLGTLPGELSLQRQQYYAHPRNSFWRIVAEVLGAGPPLAYQEGLQLLLDRRVALWDVCARARRPGSLDTSITEAVPNDFADFFQRAPEIMRICFNGAKAQSLYDRLVMPVQTPIPVTHLCLPSTSPANAATPYDTKLREWAGALRAR
jgi:TDG/mug DNA glycosylase family protein